MPFCLLYSQILKLKKISARHFSFCHYQLQLTERWQNGKITFSIQKTPKGIGKEKKERAKKTTQTGEKKHRFRREFGSIPSRWREHRRIGNSVVRRGKHASVFPSILKRFVRYSYTLITYHRSTDPHALDPPRPAVLRSPAFAPQDPGPLVAPTN